MVYGNPCAVHVDPIEKKPFYHFLPTADAFSLATAGCTPALPLLPELEHLPGSAGGNAERRFAPGRRSSKRCQDSGAPVIAFTYSEPTVFFEYMLACRGASSDGRAAQRRRSRPASSTRSRCASSAGP